MPAVRDLAVAGVLVLLGLVSLPGIDRISPDDRPVDAGAVLLVLVATAALGFRRLWPVAVLLVSAATTSAYLLLSYPHGPVILAVALAVLTAARHGPPPLSAVASLGAYGGLLLALPRHPGAIGGAAGVLAATAWVAIPYTIGVARRLVVEAHERERAAADQRLVVNERLRLAQEVHDVVGHALAAIQMQADIALHVGPEQEEAALATISRASREALEELRTTLSTAHPEGGGDRTPTPGLARLAALVAGVEAAGTHVDLSVRGKAHDLPARVDLAAYRLVQESLTNVVKHSAHPRAEVTVTYGPDELRLRIANDDLAVGPVGAGPVEGPIEGLGTSGMRTRVEQLGGTFRAGHDGDRRRYVVTATIPLSVEGHA